MLEYVLKALWAKPGRALTIVAAFALAFAAVLLSYAIASRIQITSSAALTYVVRDATIWIAGPGGPSIDPETRTLVQEHPVPIAFEQSVRDAQPGKLRRIAVRRATVEGTPVAIYWDDAAVDGVAASPELAARLAGKTVTIVGAQVEIGKMDTDLPGLSLALPYDAPGAPGAPTWLTMSPQAANDWGRARARALDLDLRDSAAGEIASRRQGTLFLIGGSLSRFDPFSFQTKFSAFEVNTATSSLLGWLARAVFLFGAIMVISSARVGIAERRAEIAALTVLGYQPEITLLIFIENLLLLAVAIPIAFAVALGLIAQVLPSGLVHESLTASLGLTLFFVPIVLAFATLWAGQYVAGQNEVQLVRGGM